MLCYIRKLVLILGTTILLLSLALYGIYHLGMNYYASQLDDILSRIAVGEFPGNEWQDGAANTAAEPTAGSRQPDDQSELAEGQTTAGSPDHVGQPSPTRSEPSSKLVDRVNPTLYPDANEAVHGSDTSQTLAGLGLTASECRHAESLLPVLGRMGLQEKLFTLQCISRFSVSELIQMFRWYRQGDGTALQQIKQWFYERFSAEDIERIRQIAEKYR